MPNEMERTLIQVQSQNQQLQAIMVQKQQMVLQQKEIEHALEELEKAKDDVYKSIGPVLVKSTKESVKTDLAELKEELDLRIKGLEKQEQKLKSLLKESQEKLQGIIKQ
jgi:prefoldin beta subunit